MALPTLPDLSFVPRLHTQEDVSRLLGLPICRPASDAYSFTLVVAFGRCKFRLNTCSVGLILQATIGGIVPFFRVSQLADHTFKFFVTNKRVGFFVANLRSFFCDQYFVSFHL
jgi:hypothetical protein